MDQASMSVTVCLCHWYCATKEQGKSLMCLLLWIIGVISEHH